MLGSRSASPRRRTRRARDSRKGPWEGASTELKLVYAAMGLAVVLALVAGSIYTKAWCSTSDAQAEGVRKWYEAWLRAQPARAVKNGACANGGLGAELVSIFNNTDCERVSTGHRDTHEARREWCDVDSIVRQRHTRPPEASNAAVACLCGAVSRWRKLAYVAL